MQTIAYIYTIYIQYYSLLPLRSVGRSNFDKGLHNLITLIKKRHELMIELLCYIMESTVDSYEKINTINNMSIESPHEEERATE